jgi:hypothetical protein
MSKKLRVWHIPQVPMKPFYVEVETLVEAKLVMDTLSIYDQFQFQNNIKPDYSNMSGLEVWNEDCEGWEDWYDEDDFNFEEHCEENEIKDGLAGRLIKENDIKF